MTHDEMDAFEKKLADMASRRKKKKQQKKKSKDQFGFTTFKKLPAVGKTSSKSENLTKFYRKKDKKVKHEILCFDRYFRSPE